MVTRTVTESTLISTIPRSFSWDGELERFAPVLEGGPGRLSSLLLLDLLGLGLLFWGFVSMDQEPNNGLVFMLLGGLLIVGLGLWILAKALLRSTRCTFILDAQGVAITPVANQQLDKRRQLLTRFWPKGKGCKSTAWAPMTRWSQAKSVKVFESKRQILITGGPCHIRLHCTQENFDTVLAMLKKQETMRNAGWLGKA